MNHTRFTSTASENLTVDSVPVPGSKDAASAVGRFVFEVNPDTWVGTLRPQARFSPGGGYFDVPYKNLLTGEEVAASTDITGAGVFEVSVPGARAFRLVHTRTSGEVVVDVNGLIG